jgi:hypothetical protein
VALIDFIVSAVSQIIRNFEMQNASEQQDVHRHAAA